MTASGIGTLIGLIALVGIIAILGLVWWIVVEDDK